MTTKYEYKTRHVPYSHDVVCQAGDPDHGKDGWYRTWGDITLDGCFLVYRREAPSGGDAPMIPKPPSTEGAKSTKPKPTDEHIATAWRIAEGYFPENSRGAPAIAQEIASLLAYTEARARAEGDAAGYARGFAEAREAAVMAAMSAVEYLHQARRARAAKGGTMAAGRVGQIQPPPDPYAVAVVTAFEIARTAAPATEETLARIRPRDAAAGEEDKRDG